MGGGVVLGALSDFFFRDGAFIAKHLTPQRAQRFRKGREENLYCRFRFVHSSKRLTALFRLSTELATLKRRYPSPNSPKAVPERQATPASSSSASASFFDDHPVPVMLGKVYNAPL